MLSDFLTVFGSTTASHVAATFGDRQTPPGLGAGAVIARALTSTEFHQRVATPLAVGKVVSPDEFPISLRTEVAESVASLWPLERATVPDVASARSWLALYERIFLDPVFLEFARAHSMDKGLEALIAGLQSSALSPMFDSEWYAEKYLSDRSGFFSPFAHFTHLGCKDALSPSPLFDTEWYLRENPDVAASEFCALDHFLRFGSGEGRSPNPLFHSAYYRFQKNADERELGSDWTDYLQAGGFVGLKPHPLFDSAWYLSVNSDVRALGMNPLQHYLRTGASEGRAPHPLFDARFYLARNPDVVTAGSEPLSHFVLYGASEGRDPHPYFSVSYYLSQLDTPADSNPLVHYMAEGWKQLLDPCPEFSTGSYLEDHPELKTGETSPLEHWIRNGAPSDSLRSYTYEEWAKQQVVTRASAILQARLASNLAYRPTISLIVPVYRVPTPVFTALVESVMQQTYTAWELCIAVSPSEESSELMTLLGTVATSDRRIKVLELSKNLGISGNSNAALGVVTGEFVGLLDHDDLLTPNALYEVARVLNEDPSTDFIYSDKDMIDEAGVERTSPLFKPGWSPDIMLNANYLTHFNVIRKERITEVGGWDPATDGAQDWDLFLRVIGRRGVVRHIPQVLYHWRAIQTSVASGGLLAKPYAAQGQLRAVQKHLKAEGWSAAEPVFQAPDLIRIRWSPSWRPAVTILCLGAESEEAASHTPALSDAVRGWGGPVELYAVREPATAASLNAIIGQLDSEVVVVVPSTATPLTDIWLSELVGPLENEAVGVVGGKTLDHRYRIRDSGWVFDEEKARPCFEHCDRHGYSLTGSVDWYRNHLAVSFNGMAFRRRDWQAIGGFLETARPDLHFCGQLVRQLSRRVLYNPFAECQIEGSFFVGRTSVSRTELLTEVFDWDQDPFFNLNLRLGSRTIVLPPKKIVSSRPTTHDFFAEAEYVANEYDYTESDIRESMDRVASTAMSPPAARVAWFVPDFKMPFYGGVMTVLRLADHLLHHHGVRPIFVGLKTTQPNDLREAISLAYPHLAEEAEVFGVKRAAAASSLDLGTVDAAIATLWTTAYAVLRLRNTRRKLYLVQDDESLFYPAGATSSLAQATYRFGFTAICNTAPLRQLYESWGGSAHSFSPAVDTSVFNSQHRSEPGERGPVTIFVYARPGQPRNCFELISAGLKMLKDDLGDQVAIFTAGADWDPGEHGLAGVVEHLGLLRYEDTGPLYRACDIGVVAMATRHPSYLPFELMASGALVCTNRNFDTEWLLRSGENSLLFHLSRSSIYQTLREAVVNAPLRSEIRARASDQIKKGYSDWQATCEYVAKIILN